MNFISIEGYLVVMLQMSLDDCREFVRFYGSDPIFICTSATIANPLQLAETLTGKSDETD